jgi:HAD superfamily hydrolase (TIGR01509 family)
MKNSSPTSSPPAELPQRFGRGAESRGAHCQPLGEAPVRAVIFDLDGVLIDSEGVWNEARRQVVLEHGGVWREDAQRAMMGMSSTEWSRYMREQLRVPLAPERISAEVVSRLERLYRRRLPLLPGAREAVELLAQRWPLALASSANRPIIDLVLRLAGVERHFAATVSSEEVARGKPAPDVYLEAARRLGIPPARCVAVEDSANGIRSAAAAGLAVVAIPNRDFPPDGEALALAAGVLSSLAQLTPERVECAAAGRTGR